MKDNLYFFMLSECVTFNLLDIRLYTFFFLCALNTDYISITHQIRKQYNVPRLFNRKSKNA